MDQWAIFNIHLMSMAAKVKNVTIAAAHHTSNGSFNQDDQPFIVHHVKDRSNWRLSIDVIVDSLYVSTKFTGILNGPVSFPEFY